jgi:hypothetical protein
MTEEPYAVSCARKLIGYVGCLGPIVFVGLTALVGALTFAGATDTDWCLVSGLILSATAWAFTRGPKTLIARAIHPLAVSWAVSLAVLLPVLISARFAEASHEQDAEPLLTAYERTIVEVAGVLGHVQLSWGGTLAVLSVLMLMVVYLPHARPVSAFMTVSRYSGSVLGVVNVLVSFTFFAAVAAPGHGAVVLRRAQAVFDRGLAREGAIWRRVIVARAVSLDLATAERAAQASRWMRQIAAIKNEQVQRELIQHFTGTGAETEAKIGRSERLTLPTAAATLTDQRRATANLQQELDKGFAEILKKTANEPGAEVIDAVMKGFVDSLAADQAISGGMSVGLALNLSKEAFGEFVQPFAERAVAMLRDRFWAMPPVTADAVIEAAVTTLQETHAKRASLFVAKAEALAAEARRDMELGYTLPASEDSFNAWRACQGAEYEAALARDVPGVSYDELGSVRGLPSLTGEDIQSRVRSVTDRVRKIREDIRIGVESRVIEEKVEKAVRE